MGFDHVLTCRRKTNFGTRNRTTASDHGCRLLNSRMATRNPILPLYMAARRTMSLALSLLPLPSLAWVTLLLVTNLAATHRNLTSVLLAMQTCSTSLLHHGPQHIIRIRHGL